MPKSLIEQGLRKIVSKICSFKEAKTWKIHRMEHIVAHQFNNIELGYACVDYLIQKQKWRDKQAIQKALEELKKETWIENYLGDVEKCFGEVKDAKNKILSKK